LYHLWSESLKACAAQALQGLLCIFYKLSLLFSFNNISCFHNYGSPSISPVYTFAAMLIQIEKDYSERELEGETIFDNIVKFALTAPNIRHLLETHNPS
jgi:hypothetical protein